MIAKSQVEGDAVGSVYAGPPHSPFSPSSSSSPSPSSSSSLKPKSSYDSSGSQALPPAPDPDALPQLPYCDACDTACVLMHSGGRRKLQSRYEGFLLVKRVHGGPYATRHFASCSSPDDLRPSAHVQCPVPYERRHSCGDVIDTRTDFSPTGSSGTYVPGPSSVPPVSSFSSYHFNECSLNNPTWEKLVNLHSEGQIGGGPQSPRVVNGGSGGPQLLNNNLFSSDSGRKSRKQSGGSSGGGHLRLSRKKSHSQDSLIGRRIRVASEGPRGATDAPLNNSILNTHVRLNSTLSRSEGSIHNVTNPKVQGVNNAHGGGSVGIKSEVELTRLPKKLFDRVTGEMGHIVFYLERWREEYIFLTQCAMCVKLTDGTLEVIVPYSQLEDVRAVPPCTIAGQHHCLLVLTRKGSVMMQASTTYVRDQWLHTILWKKNAYKYRSLLKTATRSEVLLKELKNLVDLSLSTPLHDSSVYQVPLELASSILSRSEVILNREMKEEIIVTLAPLLENSKPSPEICSFFSRHCTDNPRSRLVIDMFTPVVTRILKHNMDFGKYPHVRKFVQDYIQALNSQNDGQRLVHQFVHDMHGPSCHCPHLRVLPNLIVVCNSAISSFLQNDTSGDVNLTDFSSEKRSNLACYISILVLICEYDDWRPGLAQLLQPVPFNDEALSQDDFMRQILPVVRKIGTDPRCEVHQMVLGPRENREGWIHFLSPSSLACCDKGETWIAILKTLLSCCYRRKKLLRMLLKSLGSCMLLALRDDETAQEILCLMLEWQLVEGSDQCLQIITTLQSTPSGKQKYQDLCDRQLHLTELQQKGGPRKLTLPSRSTDADVCKFLSSGPFGNLEVLSLACTRVTSACAEQLIKLPSLKYLNLWSTQFGDSGLQEICEHLHNLQVLNLCETSVTDKGLNSLTSLKNLRVLNLNSTRLSLETFELLKESLPSLQEVDVRYTDAW